MLTGWQLINHQWHYLHTKETAMTKTGIKEGAMATGWYFDNQYQKWFYFDGDGYMATGWREVDKKEYYFNPLPDGTRGAMAVSTEVDGHAIGADGAVQEEQ